MNDLELIDKHGPAAEPLTDRALADARAQLHARWASGSRRTDGPGTPRRPRRIALIAVAATAAVGLTVAPALLRSHHSVALASVDPLTFPVTPTWLPDGLPLQRFTFNPQSAMYGADPSCAAGTPCTANRVTISVSGDWQRWEVPSTATDVDVDGHPGKLFPAPWNPSHPEQHLAWADGDGEVLAVTGEGRFADPAVLERIADSVVDRRQQVDLFLTVAPAGWPVYGYLSDDHVSYGDEGQLTVTLLKQPEQVDLIGYGARDAHDVSVDGRHGVLGRQADESGDTVAWVLTSTAPDGQAFSLQAPGDLTEGQVLQVAAGVRHR